MPSTRFVAAAQAPNTAGRQGTTTNQARRRQGGQQRPSSRDARPPRTPPLLYILGGGLKMRPRIFDFRFFDFRFSIFDSRFDQFSIRKSISCANDCHQLRKFDDGDFRAARKSKIVNRKFFSKMIGRISRGTTRLRQPTAEAA